MNRNLNICRTKVKENHRVINDASVLAEFRREETTRTESCAGNEIGWIPYRRFRLALILLLFYAELESRLVTFFSNVKLK